MSCAAIIVAAGRSRRMGFDKLAAPLLGRPVLQHALEACLRAPSIGMAVVVAPEERFATLTWDPSRRVVRAEGGAERFHSVIHGLEALDAGCEFVAVHDGARPCVGVEQIEACLEAARESGAAALAHHVTETLKRARHDGLVAGTVDREGLWAMETPQVFRCDLLRRAYDEVRRSGLHVTDDVSAAEAIGVAARLVENPRPNPKITVPRDLAAAEAILRGAEEPG